MKEISEIRSNVHQGSGIPYSEDELGSDKCFDTSDPDKFAVKCMGENHSMGLHYGDRLIVSRGHRPTLGCLVIVGNFIRRLRHHSEFDPSEISGVALVAIIDLIETRPGPDDEYRMDKLFA